MIKTSPDIWADAGLMMFVTYPIAVCGIWSYVVSKYTSTPLQPFLLQFLIFCLYQLLFRFGTRTAVWDRMELPVFVSLVQLASGVISHVGISVHRLLFNRVDFCCRQVLLDHISIWCLGGLYCLFLPSCRYFVSNQHLPRRTVNYATVLLVFLGYLLLLPTLYYHDVHFHTSRLMFGKISTLLLGLFLVYLYPRRMIGICLITVSLIFLFLWIELPWGIKLFPRTLMYLEKLYGSLAVMALLGMFSVRSVALANSGRSGTTKLSFQLPFYLLLTVFHIAEQQLYSTHLASATSTAVSAALVWIFLLSLHSSGWLHMVPLCLLEAQLGLKATTLLMHLPTSLGGGRIALDTGSGTACFLLVFLVAVSLRAGHLFSGQTGSGEDNSWIVAALRVSGLPVAKTIVIIACLLSLRETVLISVLYAITMESVVTSPSVHSCLVLGIVLDFACSVRHMRGSGRIMRLLLVLVACGSLLNIDVSLGLTCIGIYAVMLQHESKPLSKMVLLQALLLGAAVFWLTSAVAVIATAVTGPVTTRDQLIMASLATIGHMQWRLTRSSRRGRRHLQRLLCVMGVMLWASGAVLSSGNCWRLAAGSGYPAVMLVLLTTTSLSSQSQLEPSEAVTTASHVRLWARAACTAVLVGGLTALRGQMHHPLSWILPLCTAMLPRSLPSLCSCGRAALYGPKLTGIGPCWSLPVSGLGLHLGIAGIGQAAYAILGAGPDTLHLNMALSLCHWAQLLLCSLLILAHALMLTLTLQVHHHHDLVGQVNSESGCLLLHIDALLLVHSAMVPTSLLFLFCATNPVCWTLAIWSFVAGLCSLVR